MPDESGLRRVGVLALVALVGEIVFLPWLVEVDAAVWRAVLFWRDCRTDAAVDLVVDIATRAAMVLLVVVAALSVRASGVRATWPPLAVCAVGLYLGAILKDILPRERPSMLLAIAPGHSFPSAHVMNTTLAALAVVVLAGAFRHPASWRVAAAMLVAIVMAGRLLIAHHWITDGVGGALAALALVGLCLAPFRRRPFATPFTLAILLSSVMLANMVVPSLVLRLPSPLMVKDARTLEVIPGAAIGGPMLRGRWERSNGELRSDPIAWLEGAGTIAIDTLHAAEATLGIAMRPDAAAPRCVRVSVGVNDEPVASFVPFVGWREYRLQVPQGVLRPGRNEIHLAVRDEEGAPWRLAVDYVRARLADRPAPSAD